MMLHRAVWLYEFANAMPLSFFPLADVLAAIDKFLRPMAILFTLDKVTIVRVSTLDLQFALALHRVISPIADIGIAVRV